MKRLMLLLAALAAAGLLAGAAAAQGHSKDAVTVIQKGSTTRVTGTVLAETWKSVDVDRDGDGRADDSYRTDQVLRVDYANRPQYLIEAQKLTYTPKVLIEKLTRAYNDDATHPNVLQHAYYLIAKSWADQAKTDPSLAPKAAEAYGKLFAKIPDTRYAVSGRIELGSLLLSLGKPEEAVAPFKELADGAFGPAVSQEGLLLMSRAQLAGGRFADAERALTKLAEDPKIEGTETGQEVKLLRSRSLVGQKKLDEAWGGISEALSGKPTPRILAMSYGVLGDYFAAKGDFRTALTAYLKVPLMYGQADPVEKAEAVRQAAEMLNRLGRQKDVEALKKAAGE